ncbi:hypothetical protein FM104_13145 [Microbacterium esteraromaticum]|uniref:Uncharacterized protein n=1 Tax=Microbacterium esteraromaticum TaxID=57043 RepID=A0A1R4KIM9_9MICO|nr:hypothetical protein FM104_13145 [Microbacterium esteraromaticum]
MRDNMSAVYVDSTVSAVLRDDRVPDAEMPHPVRGQPFRPLMIHSIRLRRRRWRSHRTHLLMLEDERALPLAIRGLERLAPASALTERQSLRVHCSVVQLYRGAPDKCRRVRLQVLQHCRLSTTLKVSEPRVDFPTGDRLNTPPDRPLHLPRRCLHERQKVRSTRRCLRIRHLNARGQAKTTLQVSNCALVQGVVDRLREKWQNLSDVTIHDRVRSAPAGPSFNRPLLVRRFEFSHRISVAGSTHTNTSPDTQGMSLPQASRASCDRQLALTQTTYLELSARAQPIPIPIPIHENRRDEQRCKRPGVGAGNGHLFGCTTSAPRRRPFRRLGRAYLKCSVGFWSRLRVLAPLPNGGACLRPVAPVSTSVRPFPGPSPPVVVVSFLDRACLLLAWGAPAERAHGAEGEEDDGQRPPPHHEIGQQPDQCRQGSSEHDHPGAESWTGVGSDAFQPDHCRRCGHSGCGCHCREDRDPGEDSHHPRGQDWQLHAACSR